MRRRWRLTISFAMVDRRRSRLLQVSSLPSNFHFPSSVQIRTSVARVSSLRLLDIAGTWLKEVSLARQTTVRAFVQHRASSAPKARPRCLIMPQVSLVEIWRLKSSLTFKLSGQRTLWPGEQKKAMFTLGFSPELLSAGHCPSPQGTASSSRRIFRRCCKSSKRPRNGMRGAL